MSKPFLMLLTLFSLSHPSPLLAHAGIDHGDNCFIHISGAKLRLGGFQSEQKIGGGKHFCHLFPATGTVIFTFEPEAIKSMNKQLDLKFLAAESYWDILFDFDNAFQQLLTQVRNKSTIEHSFPNSGLYAMEAYLRTDESELGQFEPSQNNTQRFLFLVGFPIIKILVLIAFGFLLLLGFVLLKQLKAGVADNTK